MTNIYGKGDKGKATKLHGEVVRARGFCEKCGAKPPHVKLECAHIFGRRYSATRTDENNAWCLCSGCHRWLTERPYEHVQFAIGTRGQAGFDLLRDKAYNGVGQRVDKTFWHNEVIRLESLLRVAS